MAVGADGPFDAILQDTETNPKIELGLVLDYNQQQGGELGKRWIESRAETLPPRRSQGALSWQMRDPKTDLEFAQEDWSDGAFRAYYEDGDRKYAISNGMDMRWKGVAALGPKRTTPRGSVPINGKIQSNLFLANGDFEEGLTSGWASGTGATLAVNTSVVRTGNYSLQITVAQGTSAGAIASQSAAWNTFYRLKTVTVFAYVRRASGSNAGVSLRVFDGVDTTNSSAVTSDSWTYVSAQHTFNTLATEFTVSIRHSATTSTDAHVFRIDDLHCFPAGGVESSGKGFAIRSSTDPDELYAIVGRCVVSWTEGTFRWDLQHFNTTATATDIQEFDDTIFVAYGDFNTGNQYVYGDLSSGFVASAINSTNAHHDNHATYFVKARNAYGSWALWKAGPSTSGGAEVNTIQWSTSPTNIEGVWSPSSAFVVGSASRAITGLHSFGDNFVVTKVDGIWTWDSTLYDFVNLTQEWENSSDADNGKKGQFWGGALWFTSARQGFQRLDSSGLLDVSTLLISPRLTDFGGRVTAMTGTARELILGLDQPIADATEGKTSRLVRLSIINNQLMLHMMNEPSIGRIDAITMHRGNRMWAFGRSYDGNLGNYFLSTTLWEEPDKTAAPFRDVTPAIESTGFFETSIWHGGLPETDKALIALSIWCEDLDTQHTITVDIGVDGQAAKTTRVGVFRSPSRIQTLLFKNIVDPLTNAQARFVQIRFTFDTDDNISPKMYAFALHTQLANEPIKVWDLFATVGDKTVMRTGVPLVKNKAEMQDVFEALENQVFPITLIEDFGQSHGGAGQDGSKIHLVRLQTYVRQPRTSDNDGEEIWFLRLQEVPIGK